MKYQNSTKYTGKFAGIEVVFELHNFSPATIEKFNETLAREAVKSNENRGGQYSRVSS
jgi:hypothetical protein